MSSISAGTSVGTALVSTGDTTGDLVLKTGSSATTAVTIAGSNQAVTLAQPLAVTSGGTGATTAAGARTALGTNDAANITTGTLGTARLGSGTANSTTFLRGDQTWATVSGGVTSLNGQTGDITNTGYGAIGSYVLAFGAASGNYNGGDTIAGSSLTRGNPGGYDRGGANWYVNDGAGGSTSAGPWITTGGGVFTGLGLSGTWRAMTNGGLALTNGRQYHLWVRVS